MHYSPRQTNTLHSITVMPQREVEMDGYHYERDPHSHEPPMQSFPLADQFPVCHLGNRIFQQQKGKQAEKHQAK